MRKIQFEPYVMVVKRFIKHVRLTHSNSEQSTPRIVYQFVPVPCNVQNNQHSPTYLGKSGTQKHTKDQNKNQPST